MKKASDINPHSEALPTMKLDDFKREMQDMLEAGDIKAVKLAGVVGVAGASG